jgi:hypothetical protein
MSKTIIETAAKSFTVGSDEQKSAIFYGSFSMDSIDKIGIASSTRI